MKDLQMYIDGGWVDSQSGARFTAHNPATGEAIASLPEGTRADAQLAIQAANNHKHKLAGMPIWERSRLCLRIAEVMESRKQELARTLCVDQGKPLFSEAIPEVETAITGFRDAAEHIKWLETPVINLEDLHKRAYSFRQPRGVYGVITPWNYPVNIPVEYLSAGIATGNGVVWVPAPSTSVVAVALMECLEAAGVPQGSVNLVTGPGPVVGDEIVSHPGTDAVAFTGSHVTGHKIAERAAGKPLLLELGGNGPTIVLDDADLDRAASATAAACFSNAGQICSASERILVQRSIRDEFVERMVAEAARVRLGDPLAPETTMGPLNNQAVLTKTLTHIRDGLDRGAKVLIGGQVAPGRRTELYFEPTVITGVTVDSLLNTEETFGPVAPVLTFDTDDEALAIANANRFGLVSAVFTRTISRAFRFIENLRTGIVHVNEHSAYWEIHIPFGGVGGKSSGLGRLGGKYTLMEMTDLRTATIDLR